MGPIDGSLVQSNKSEGSLAFLPSTQAGFAFVVPATCPLRQAHRAVCRAIILLGWLISLSRAVISHVPTSSSFPIGIKDTHKKSRKIMQPIYQKRKSGAWTLGPKLKRVPVVATALICTGASEKDGRQSIQLSRSK